MLKFKKLDPRAKLPTRKNSLDAGLDVFCLDVETIPANDQSIVRTGIGLADAPENCVIQVWPKSGLDAQFGLHTGAGIIDSGYRGEILILLKNMSDSWVRLEAGDAIAQLVVVPCLRPWIIEVVSPTESERGADGGITSVLTEGELITVKPLSKRSMYGRGSVLTEGIDNEI